MKRLIIIIAVLFCLDSYSQVDIKDFTVTNLNQNYTFGDRFDYNFKIKGNYGYNEIKLKVYAESTSSNNLIGLINWNSDGDDNLSFSTYTQKNMWVKTFFNWNNRSFNTNPSKKFYLKVEYLGNSQTFIYTVPAVDSDNDGVPDNQDNCPNEVGPVSNNGCPAYPDLSIDKPNTIVSSSCLSCSPYLDLFLSSGKRHLIAGGVGAVNFNDLIIRNIGNSSSSTSKVDFYYSGDSSLNRNSDELLASINIPNLNINSYYAVDKNFTGFDIFGSDAYSPVTNGNFFIIIDIDPNNSNTEGTNGEQNNILAIPMSFNSDPTVTSKSVNNKKTVEEILISEEDGFIKIYDFYGRLVKQSKSVSKQGESEILEMLPSGIYIVKTKSSTRKVVK